MSKPIYNDDLAEKNPSATEYFFINGSIKFHCYKKIDLDLGEQENDYFETCINIIPPINVITLANRSTSIVTYFVLKPDTALDFYLRHKDEMEKFILENCEFEDESAESRIFLYQTLNELVMKWIVEEDLMHEDLLAQLKEE